MTSHVSFRKPAASRSRGASQSRAALSKDTKETQFKFRPYSIHGTTSLRKLADIKLKFQLWRGIAQAGHPENLKFELQSSQELKIQPHPTCLGFLRSLRTTFLAKTETCQFQVHDVEGLHW